VSCLKFSLSSIAIYQLGGSDSASEPD
jgi:hypothetical protein